MENPGWRTRADENTTNGRGAQGKTLPPKVAGFPRANARARGTLSGALGGVKRHGGGCTAPGDPDVKKVRRFRCRL